MNIKQLREQAAALSREELKLRKESKALLGAAREAKRKLTAEEQTADDARAARLEAIDAERKELEAEIRNAERLADLERDEPAVTSVREAVEDKPWTLGEQLQAIAEAQRPNGRIDPRLRAGPTGAGVSGDTGVSFLVQRDFSTALMEAAMEESVLAPMCRTLELGPDSDTVELPYVQETSRAEGSRYGGVQVYWRKEAATVTPKMPAIALKEIQIQELMGLAYATDRTLRDARLLESIFTQAFAAEFAFKIDDAIFRGDGVGKPLGFTDATAPKAQQAKETGQAADTVVVENISKMWTRMPARSKARAVWLINSEVGPQLDGMYKVVGVSGVDPRVVTYDAQGALRIKGRPVVEIEQASALGDEGDITLADMSQYLLLRKGGLQSAQSMHVRFIYGENTYRWVMPVNGLPGWHSAVTPYKGAATKSPFVTLAAR